MKWKKYVKSIVAFLFTVVAIAAHMAANAASIFLEKTGWMQWVSGNVSLYYLTTAVLFLAGYLCFREISLSRQREAKHRWKN